MNWDDLELEVEFSDYERDTKIDEAKKDVLEYLTENKSLVFFERQLAIIFEDKYFHWITVKALLELAREGSVETDTANLGEGVTLRFFRMRSNRYWKRQANRIIELVKKYSQTDFIHAIGHQGELLVDAALPLADFKQLARNAKSFNKVEWTRTGHNLDRVVERAGVAYGVEIKNTLPYIPRDELRIKLEMCKALDLKPLFISRMAPKNYSYEIIQQGGISWILGTQFYPFGFETFAAEIRTDLMLPVAAPTHIEDGAITRLLKAIKWQERRTQGR